MHVRTRKKNPDHMQHTKILVWAICIELSAGQLHLQVVYQNIFSAKGPGILRSWSRICQDGRQGRYVRVFRYVAYSFVKVYG